MGLFPIKKPKEQIVKEIPTEVRIGLSTSSRRMIKIDKEPPKPIKNEDDLELEDS